MSVWAAMWVGCTDPATVRPTDLVGAHSGTRDSGSLRTTTGHTGFAPLGRAPTATWHSQHENHTAGRGLWVGDLDGDTLVEVLIGAPMYTDGYGGEEHEVVFRTEGLPASGLLPDVAVERWPGIDDDDLWGDSVVGLASLGQVAIDHHPDTRPDAKVFVFDPSDGRTTPDQASWRVTLHSDYRFPLLLAACEGVAGGALCVSGSGTAFGGEVRVFPKPADRTVRRHALQLIGDDGDDAKYVQPAADGNGDGVPDAIVGGIYHRAVGAVALVSGTVTGSHRLWDAAYATLGGRRSNGRFGTFVAPGDLDGDGAVDLLVTAPNEPDGGALYVFRGPFAGERSAAQADVVVTGATNGVLADLDGDGVTDLAAAGPHLAGVFFGPISGTRDFGEADLFLRSDGQTDDGFGWRIGTGDLDGDGVQDLVVSAPYDDRGAPSAGAVHVYAGIRR